MTTMPKRSAGLIMYRWREAVLEVFLVHPGGPFWAKKDMGAWSIPKGEPEPNEEPLEVAKRDSGKRRALPRMANSWSSGQSSRLAERS